MVVVRSTSGDSMVDVSSQGVKDSIRHSPTLASEAVSNASYTETPKPFFIFDWLEQVNQDDLDLARRMLKTPQKVEKTSKECKGSTESLRKELFPPPSNDTTRSISTGSLSTSCFRKRSVAIGNGWNAKGLQKAKLGEWQSALACWENALEIRTQILGETNLDVANTLNNIGISLGKLNRFDESIAALNRALDIRTGHFGNENVEVCATLHNIGNVLHQAGDLEAAIQCFWDTKVLQEKLLGRDHVQVARACIAMGHIYYQAEEFKDAKEAYLDALSIFERAGVPRTDIEVRTTHADVKQIDRVLQGRP